MSHKNPVPGLKLKAPLSRAALIFAASAALIGGCGKDPISAGNGYMKSGEYPSAVIEFKNAVQANPDSTAARLALADALERVYDPAGAEQQIRKAIDKGGDANALIPRIALLMLDRNELAKVISEFKDRHLSSPEAESNLRAVVAVAYLGQKQLALAETQLAAVTKDTEAVKLAKAQALLSQNKKEQAIAALDTSVADKDAAWWVLRGVGRIYESDGKHEQAFQFMNRAYEAAPWHRGVMGEFGEFLISAGKLDQAITIRNKLKKLAPNFYWTHYLDALVLSQQGRQDDSHAAALKVLAASPEHLPATLLVASAELHKGEMLMANNRLKKVVSQHPYSIPTLQLLAETQLRLGQNNEAAETIKRGVSAAPANSRLLSLRADSEVSRGMIKEAVATLQQLHTADPENPSHLLRLSALHARLGDKASAKKLLDQATDAGKDHPAIRDQIVKVALGMGDSARVQKLADHAVQTRPQDPQSHLTLAIARGIQKDTAGAWQETLAALDLQPAFQPALNALQMMARSPAQRDELLSRYAKAVQTKSAGEQTFLIHAQLLRETKSDRAAILALLQKGVGAVPGSSALRAALADELFRAGNSDAALSAVQTGASADNATPDARALLARTYERIGDNKLAMETYRKLATNYPQRADWKLKLAELEVAAGFKKEATTILRSLITDRPFDPAAYIALAKLTSLDSPREALSVARELGERKPNKLTAMLLEGDILAQAGQLDDAVVQYGKAAKAGVVPTALLRTVEVLDRSNRGQAAEQELADTLRKYPENPEVVGFAAQRLRSQGKSAKGIEMLQKLADKNPQNPFLLNDLAWAQLEAKQDGALKNAAMAAELAPDNPQILDTLGMAQAQSGKQGDAISTLRTAVNLAPKAAILKLHLAELLMASGDKKEAGMLIRAIEKNQLGSRDQDALKRLSSTLGA